MHTKLTIPERLKDLRDSEKRMSAKENAAFERCTDVITNMIMKYGPVLKRKWAVDEWLRNIHVECFGTKNEWRSFMAEDKKRKLLLQ